MDFYFKGKLLVGIHNAPSRNDELVRIARSTYVNSGSTKTDGQLNAILNKLVINKYLIEIGKQGTQFRATGKWSMLYDLIEFIELNSVKDETFEMEQERLK